MRQELTLLAPLPGEQKFKPALPMRWGYCFRS